MAPVPTTQTGILHFGVPDNSITAEERGFFAFPSYKSVSKVPIPLYDARQDSSIVQGAAGLDVQSFAYIRHRSALAGEEKWFDDHSIEDIYLRECEELICEVTGAKKAVASNCSLRRRPVAKVVEPNSFVKRDSEIDQNLAKIPRDKCTVLGKAMDSAREPARIVHVDYSLQGLKDSARYCREDMAEIGSEALSAEDTGTEVPRYAAYSIWRPISTVKRDPLAVCDWRTVNHEDLVAIRYRNPSSINESGEYIMEAYNVVPPGEGSRQKWYWMPEQKQDEVLIIKFADTKANGSGKIASHCLHGSPIVSGTENEAPRESIEVRVLAFW